MRYSEAVAALYALSPRGVRLGLARMRRALEGRGHPERAFPSVLIAGTNGKGSVAATLSSILGEAGLRVGLFTSPHLHRLVERFQIGGEPMAERELSRRAAELVPWLHRPSSPALTFFEATTLLAFEYFRDQQVDLAVLEVGLGGRLDSTNVVRPWLSVITHVGLDHQDRLGATLSAIAAEKAGIIKRGVPVVMGAQEPAAGRVIAKVARARKAPLVRARPSERAPSLRGAFQRENLGMVLATLPLLTARGLTISEAAVARGLDQVRWPGRMELVRGAPSVLFDAAHNPDACAALAEELRVLKQYKRRVLVFGVMRDKQHQAMVPLLLPQVAQAIFATPATPRALAAADLAARYGGRAIDEPLAAFRTAQALAGKRGLVIVAGSIFLMGPLRAHHLGLPADPPIAM